MKQKINNKKIKAAALLLLLLALLAPAVLPLTAAAQEEISVTEISAEGEIISDVNVRKGPGTNYDKIGAVRQGETVKITGKSADGWYRIAYEGGEGFLYGQYVTILSEQPADGGGEGEEDSQDFTDEDTPVEEPEEEEESKIPDFGMLKAAAVAVIILVIIVMIVLTLRSIRKTQKEAYEEAYADDEYDDDDDDDEDEYEDEDDEYDDDEDDDDDEDEDDEYDDDDEDDDEDNDAGSKGTSGMGNKTDRKAVKADARTLLIREEDYQLHIDPKYFEDDPIAQPECVTGYLLKQQEEQQKEQEKGENSGELQMAMDKLQKLEEEIEKLKKKQ